MSLGESGHESTCLSPLLVEFSWSVSDKVFSNCFDLTSSLFRFPQLGGVVCPAYGLFLAYGPWFPCPICRNFSRRLYRDFRTEDMMTVISFFRKKDLGIGFFGQWVSLALSQMWFSRFRRIVLVLLLLQLRFRGPSSQVIVNLGNCLSFLSLACGNLISHSSPSSFFLNFGNPVRFTAFPRKKDRVPKDCFSYLVHMPLRILQVGSLF